MIKTKIVTQIKIKQIAKRLRKTKKTIVFSNGAFDILHAGHVTYLEKAKSKGDVLIVGVNSDQSIKTYKSKNRPINPQRDRLKVLAALAKAAKYFSYFAMAVSAIGGAWYAVTHWGEPPSLK